MFICNVTKSTLTCLFATAPLVLASDTIKVNKAEIGKLRDESFRSSNGFYETLVKILTNLNDGETEFKKNKFGYYNPPAKHPYAHIRKEGDQYVMESSLGNQYQPRVVLVKHESKPEWEFPASSSQPRPESPAKIQRLVDTEALNFEPESPKPVGKLSKCDAEAKSDEAMEHPNFHLQDLKNVTVALIGQCNEKMRDKVKFLLTFLEGNIKKFQPVGDTDGQWSTPSSSGAVKLTMTRKEDENRNKLVWEMFYELTGNDSGVIAICEKLGKRFVWKLSRKFQKKSNGHMHTVKVLSLEVDVKSSKFLEPKQLAKLSKKAKRELKQLRNAKFQAVFEQNEVKCWRLGNLKISFSSPIHTDRDLERKLYLDYVAKNDDIQYVGLGIADADYDIDDMIVGRKLKLKWRPHNGFDVARFNALVTLNSSENISQRVVA